MLLLADAEGGRVVIGGGKRSYLLASILLASTSHSNGEGCITAMMMVEIKFQLDRVDGIRVACSMETTRETKA